MKATPFLRLASILALLACLGHTFLFVTYVPNHGPQETEVITAMKVHHFNFGGFTHSYWELYFGYGLFVSIGCLVECVLFWQLGDLAKSGVPPIKWILVPLILGEGAYSFLMLKYFFLIPIIVHISTAISLILAFVAVVSTSPMAKAFTQAAGSRSN